MFIVKLQEWLNFMIESEDRVHVDNTITMFEKVTENLYHPSSEIYINLFCKRFFFGAGVMLLYTYF